MDPSPQTAGVSPNAPKPGGVRWILFALIFLAAGAALGIICQMRRGEEIPVAGAADNVSDQFIHNGYYPLAEVMEAAGYRTVSGTRHAFEKSAAKLAVKIVFDFKTGNCRKNQYAFDIANKWLESGGEFFIHGTLAEKMLNHRLERDGDGKMRAVKISYAPHEWIAAFPPLIAHAGGIYRTPTENFEYTNTVAALTQNYDVGHRVFEFDFQITRDGKLALAHAGLVPGDDDGRISMSSKEWLAYKGIGGGLQTALVGDILDEMLVNTDMFVVTDTKQSGNDMFRIIHAEAASRDITLLDRIIPQIYNREMYDDVMEVYAFPSVIFTTYATNESPMDIVDFCAGKDAIRVITTSILGGGSIDVVLTQLANRQKLLVYTHTPNSFSEIVHYRNQGVHGFYTDYLTPADMALYDKSGGTAAKR